MFLCINFILFFKFVLEQVDITLPENSIWYDRYKYDIPVFHLNGQFLMMHRVNLKKLEKSLSNLELQNRENWPIGIILCYWSNQSNQWDHITVWLFDMLPWAFAKKKFPRSHIGDGWWNPRCQNKIAQQGDSPLSKYTGQCCSRWSSGFYLTVFEQKSTSR